MKSYFYCVPCTTILGPTTTCPACPVCATVEAATCPPPVTCPICPTTPLATSPKPTTTMEKQTTAAVASTTEEQIRTTKPKLKTTLTPTQAPKTTTLPPAGWRKFIDHYYYWNPSIHYWAEAEAWCQSQGAHLASLHSPAEGAFIARLLPDYGPFLGLQVWLGASALPFSSNYQWIDSTPWDYWNWEMPYPFAEVESTCVRMIVRSKLDQGWIQFPCSFRASFVCKKSIYA
uniref:C-type lectin domain-containing protein n=1 Tax=Steinernema glaseri TaxID=37863 RepID=A0A1I7ZMP3_9BILA